MSLIGIDIGGTGIKASAFAQNGEMIASEHREYAPINNRPGCFELDPKLIWDDAKEIISIVARACNKEILAITVSAIGESFVCFDKDEHILTNFITYHDQRGKELFQDFVTYFKEDAVCKVLGTRASFIQTLHRLRALKYERPQIIEKTKKISFAGDFLLHMLGAREHCCDYTTAMTTSCFNVGTQDWQKEYIQWAGIDPEIFPRIVRPGTQIGTISPSIAQELGIHKGTRLVLGPYDQVSSSIGANAYHPGQVFNAIGTCDAMLTFTKSITEAKKACDYGLFYDLHYFQDTYTVHAGPQYSGGSIFQWFRDHLGGYEKYLYEKEGKDFYKEYEKNLPLEPTNVMVICHFAGTIFDKGPKGAILNLSLDTKNETIYRAFMEGETYYARARLNVLKKIGLPVEMVVTTGGGSKSDMFMQIRADNFKVPVATVDCREPGVLGNALLGGVAAGVYDSVSDITDKFVRIAKIFEPNPKNMCIYDERFEINQELSKLIQNTERSF